MEGKEPRIAKTLLKEDTVEDLANIKTYKVIIINPMLWYCSMDEPVEQKNSETDIFTFINLIFIIFLLCKYEYLLMGEIKM